MNGLKNYWERILLICLTLFFLGDVVLQFFGAVYFGDSMKFLFNVASPIQKTVDLDFSNKTGTARIQSSFTDLLVSSDGSEKKGEGYVVHLKTYNPSSIQLSSSNIVYSWKHNNESKAATITNPNENLLVGSSVRQSAYLSPVVGDELKAIKVTVNYDLMRSR